MANNRLTVRLLLDDLDEYLQAAKDYCEVANFEAIADQLEMLVDDANAARDKCRSLLVSKK